MSLAFEKSSSALNCVESGKGETSLVFLHYFGDSSHTWCSLPTPEPTNVKKQMQLVNCLQS
jgi:hypothetical protein